MKMFESAVMRSTLTDAVGSDGGDLGLDIGRLQTTFPSVTLSKLKGLLPFGAAQASFHGIADELLWSNLLLRRSFLDLLQQLAWKFYVLSCHGSILLHFRQTLTYRVAPPRGKVGEKRPKHT
jgi:hypothetical protein